MQRGEMDSSLPRRFGRQMRTFQRRLDEMQRGILEVRMVPLSQVFDKLARVVRRLSRQFEKQISFYVSGGETEIDKLIVEELADPLMHLIRNAIDHGIEPGSKRMAASKPNEGTLALTAAGSAHEQHRLVVARCRVDVEHLGAGRAAGGKPVRNWDQE